MLNQNQLNDRLIQAAQEGDLRALARALKDGANAKEHDSLALWLAAERGHVECVKLLIEVSEPRVGNSYALRRAAACGHADCVRVLMEVSEPKVQNSYALRAAAEEGHVECVKLLMEASDPLANDSHALRMAAAYGHGDCVELLLPASDPLAVGGDGVEAAGLARESGHVEVASMIEAFIESQALSGCVQTAKMKPRAKSAL
jgi:ankyrin repeat protein